MISSDYMSFTYSKVGSPFKNLKVQKKIAKGNGDKNCVIESRTSEPSESDSSIDERTNREQAAQFP